VRIPIIRVPEVAGSLQVVPFLDFGTGWNVENDLREPPDPDVLVGTGFGLLWQMGNEFTARFDWGIPLVHVDSEKNTWQENGLYFLVEYNIRF